MGRRPALALLADAEPERRQRLQEMHDLYTFIAREFPQIMERWREERKNIA